ncbi:MAG: hypothetical protein ACREC5_08520 [Thermoplasmata archaeon]
MISRPGLGPSKLPPELLESFKRTAPLSAPIKCRPLQPLSVASADGSTRVWV